MTSITHWDGNDVVVLDSRGRLLGAIAEVLLEHDRAVVAVDAARAPRRLAFERLPSVVIHSAKDGLLRWAGPARVVLV